jgi:shikimate kinase
MSRRIFLVGPRGSGKTTVAVLLAERLGLGWIDADALLEERAGQSIRTLFASEGEAGFRQREAALLAELCSWPALVIATGGGVVLRQENRERMRDAGLVIWLTADADTLWARIAADAGTTERRPALGAGGRAEVVEIVAAREPHYRASAHFTVETQALEPAAVCDSIVEWLTTRPG